MNIKNGCVGTRTNDKIIARILALIESVTISNSMERTNIIAVAFGVIETSIISVGIAKMVEKNATFSLNILLTKRYHNTKKNIITSGLKIYVANTYKSILITL